MEIVPKEMVEGKVSAKEIESLLFKQMLEIFRDLLVRVYTVLDEYLLHHREKHRFEVVDKRPTKLSTIFGTVEIVRRYYLDRETKEYVCLLDELIGLEGNKLVSPFLEEIAINWAVKGPSYRDARDRLEELLGEQVLSHETIRQRVLKLGDKIDQEPWMEDTKTDKEEKEVLLVEVDGLNGKLQREKQRSAEAKIGVLYEGWEKLHPSSKEHRLKNKSYWVSVEDGETFWEEFSRLVYQKYEVTDETVVVINGDGAGWIKKGTKYFPQAIYVYDRFHLNKWLREVLNKQPEKLKEALEASRRYDVGGLLKAVAEAEKDSKTKEERDAIKDLRHFLLDNREALRDYREILREKGIDTSNMRAMGAAESNMDLFAKRVKKHGYSWSKEGLEAILSSRMKKLENTLEHWIGLLKSSINTINTEPLSKTVVHVARRVTDETKGVINGRMPVLYGPDQDKNWVNHGMRKISRINYEIL